jgi:membrane protein required for beta-lactamase induction
VILDIRTLYVVTAITCLVLGALQLVAYCTQRFERWPAWWGLSMCCLDAGRSLSRCAASRQILSPRNWRTS